MAVPHILCLGGEDHALRIPFLIALRNSGFDVTAASSGKQGAFDRAGLAHRFYQFDRFAMRGTRASLRSLAKLIDELRPDIVQTFDTKPNLLGPLAVRGAIPLIRTINGLGWVFSERNLKALGLRSVYCVLQRFASSSTTTTVFQNRDDLSLFKRFRLLGRSHAQVISGSGIDIQAFEHAANHGPSVDELRQQLKIGDAPVVLTVSRLTRQKGIATLLDAAALVKEVRPDVRFLLVGPRETEGAFAIAQGEIDRHSPTVMATGARSDVPSLLRLADVFAFPTEYREGIPRALMEAALAGRPIVSTRMPGCSDVVTDRWNGLLVPARDPRALAAGILDILRNKQLADEMGRRSIALVKREFDMRFIVEQYRKLYLRALATAPLRRRALDYLTPFAARRSQREFNGASE